MIVMRTINPDEIEKCLLFLLFCCCCHRRNLNQIFMLQIQRQMLARCSTIQWFWKRGENVQRQPLNAIQKDRWRQNRVSVTAWVRDERGRGGSEKVNYHRLMERPFKTKREQRTRLCACVEIRNTSMSLFAWLHILSNSNTKFLLSFV